MPPCDEEALECKTGADPIRGVPRDGVVSFALCKGRLGAGAAASHSRGAGRLAGGRGWLALLTGIVLQRDARGWISLADGLPPQLSLRSYDPCPGRDGEPGGHMGSAGSLKRVGPPAGIRWLTRVCDPEDI